MDKDFFKNPIGKADYTLAPFWFWNDLITDEKTTEQLNMMKRINACQPVVHARFGLENEYLSEDWFARIQSVIDTAKKNDMKIWLYDENNWPSGNCSFTLTKEEKYREHYLQIPLTKLAVGEGFKLNINDKYYINITAYEKDSLKGIDLLVTADSNGEIEYKALTEIEIFAVYIAVDDYEPVGKLCVDYLSKEALRKFMDSTHEKYAEHFHEDFGKVIRGIFMDETRFCNALPWTETLKEEFIKRKGYDIVPFLTLLVKNSEKSKLIRYDYFDVVSDMYTEATFGQIFDWCEERGIKTTGHFLGEETLATQSYFGGDMMRGYKYFHIPGIDHLGNGIGSLNAKFCTSASHNYGKTTISCEAFGASGWDITFEEMVKISNWLFQQGINIILPHAFYYSIRDERKNDFPPSYFHQWKYWDSMPMYAEMAARMSSVLSEGTHEADILVYYPMETFWNYYEPDLKVKTGFWNEGPWIANDKAKFIDNQYQLVCNKLLDKNLDFDILNSDAVCNFKVEEGKIINKLTGEIFSVFVLPVTEMIPKEVVILLNQFTAQGGKVISYASDIKYVVGKKGEHFTKKELAKLDTTKFTTARKISNIVEECFNAIDLPFEIICGIDEVSRTTESFPARLIDPYIHDGEQQYGVGVTRYLKEDKRILNFTNYNVKDEDLKVVVKSSCVPEVYIPETGEIIGVDGFATDEGSYEFKFILPKNRAYFIVCGL